jgi:hypothetical protein
VVSPAGPVPFVRDGDFVRSEVTSGAPGVDVGHVRLVGVDPNPARPGAGVSVRFHADATTRLRLRVLDVRGRLVAVLFDGFAPRGPRSVTWPGTDASGRRSPAGAYVIVLEGGGVRQARKVLWAHR